VYFRLRHPAGPLHEPAMPVARKVVFAAVPMPVIQFTSRPTVAELVATRAHRVFLSCTLTVRPASRSFHRTCAIVPCCSGVM
jgi:hypothetical protein